MLQHIMKLAANNGTKQFEVLEKVTENIANVNTTGYKVRRFEQYLTEDGQINGAVRTDYEQGAIMITKREMDVAIKGPGFIPVTQPDGTVAYTRDGSFAKNAEGFMVTLRGDLVGNGIQLPATYQRLMIQADGSVQVLMEDNAMPKTVGKITLVDFANPEGLKSIGYNKLLSTDASGEPTKIENHTSIRQGNLERANVSMFSQIDQILRLNAGVISNLRIVKFSDDIYRQAVNLKQ